MTRYDDQEDYLNPEDRNEVNLTSRTREKRPRRGFAGKHPLITNLFVILVVAVLGLLIAYLSLGIFTKHGEKDQVPRVVNMSYASAVDKLHNAGFKVEIKDSVYFDDVKPGMVVDQFPSAGATVKPGRKIYIYINAVHPKEIIIDPSNDPGKPALRGLSQRQAFAQLQELGFKNIKIEYVIGDTDRVLRVTANGKLVNKMQKVPINANIVLVVYNNRKTALADSLSNLAGRGEMHYQNQIEIETDPGFQPDDEQYFEEDIYVGEQAAEYPTSIENELPSERDE